jgi:serine/threonine-protein kinase
MSPEQASGQELSSKSDIYSLGVTAYHLLSGVTPYTGTTPLSIAVQHVNNDVPYDRVRFGHVPDAAVYFLIAMTQRDPNRRPGAADVGRELRRILVQLTGRDDVRLPGIAALTTAGISLSQPAFTTVSAGRPAMTGLQPPAAPPRPPTNFTPMTPQAQRPPTAFAPEGVPPQFAPNQAPVSAPAPGPQPAFSTPGQPMAPPGFVTQPPMRPAWTPPPEKSSNAFLWIAVVVVVVMFLMFASCAMAMAAQ